VLSGEASLPPDDVVIWGASEGIELALDLARDGRKVRLIDSAAKFAPAPYIGSRAGAVMRWASQVQLIPEVGTEVLEVATGAVCVRKADGTKETIACAALVLAPGRVAHDPISEGLQGSGIQVQVIGDARSPRSYGNAIHEAAYLARRI